MTNTLNRRQWIVGLSVAVVLFKGGPLFGQQHRDIGSDSGDIREVMMAEIRAHEEHEDEDLDVDKALVQVWNKMQQQANPVDPFARMMIDNAIARDRELIGTAQLRKLGRVLTSYRAAKGFLPPNLDVLSSNDVTACRITGKQFLYFPASAGTNIGDMVIATTPLPPIVEHSHEETIAVVIALRADGSVQRFTAVEFIRKVARDNSSRQERGIQSIPDATLQALTKITDDQRGTLHKTVASPTTSSAPKQSDGKDLQGIHRLSATNWMNPQFPR